MAAWFHLNAKYGTNDCVTPYDPRPMGSSRAKNAPGYFAGQFLVAMPGMTDPRFEKAVVYMCVHSAEDGALGLIVNKPLRDVRFADILENLQIELRADGCIDIPVHRGGPVQTQFGFVLHSADYRQENTIIVSDEIGLSTSTEILKAIASGNGPSRNLMALGYAGWGIGQLDEEIKRNAWLNVPADMDLLFSDDYGSKWEKALAKLGIAAHMLSGQAGHA
jgi:putative transcriptional regulator